MMTQVVLQTGVSLGTLVSVFGLGVTVIGALMGVLYRMVRENSNEIDNNEKDIQALGQTIGGSERVESDGGIAKQVKEVDETIDEVMSGLQQIRDKTGKIPDLREDVQNIQNRTDELRSYVDDIVDEIEDQEDIVIDDRT